ncbi:RteC domain-containing protein [Pseudoflavitalea rhizosphaerae]|uniref:RteC domain-containing protein n=1 Tax=Pseudoflavitalea rhizosphaerae TaxID=1884793 RepID=UPI000F8EE681|nr:RteC domain-containing protein [Pseudoflavitalea rhizosphaerae]
MENVRNWENPLNDLHKKLLKELAEVGNASQEPLVVARLSIDICVGVMKQVKEYILTNEFPAVEQEIDFFKKIKPSFQCRLIFYNDVFEILLKKPQFSKEETARYLNREFQKLKEFHKNHLDFSKYYRSGASDLDQLYFTRKGALSKYSFHPQYLDSDSEFTSFSDYVVARGWANERLGEFLEDELEALSNPNQTKTCLEWKDTVMSLVEYGYVFKSNNTFGDATLKQIFEGLEAAFGIKVGNHSRYFQHILFRNEGPTAAQDKNKIGYLKYIDKIEEKNFSKK